MYNLDCDSVSNVIIQCGYFEFKLIDFVNHTHKIVKTIKSRLKEIENLQLSRDNEQRKIESEYDEKTKKLNDDFGKQINSLKQIEV